MLSVLQLIISLYDTILYPEARPNEKEHVHGESFIRRITAFVDIYNGLNGSIISFVLDINIYIS
jgi:hypothetical protein